MPNIAVVDMAGKSVGEITLSDAVFGIKPNAAVMHAAVVNYLANQRQGTQSTLTRTEVSGGGKKPWRQKGTGHARQGSTRAPHMIVLDELKTETYKTKVVADCLKAIGAGKKTLIVLEDNNAFAVKSIANIAGAKSAQVGTINTYDIINADTLVVVKNAVAKLEEVYA